MKREAFPVLCIPLEPGRASALRCIAWTTMKTNHACFPPWEMSTTKPALGRFAGLVLLLHGERSGIQISPWGRWTPLSIIRFYIMFQSCQTLRRMNCISCACRKAEARGKVPVQGLERFFPSSWCAWLVNWHRLFLSHSDGLGSQPKVCAQDVRRKADFCSTYFRPAVRPKLGVVLVKGCRLTQKWNAKSTEL